MREIHVHLENGNGNTKCVYHDDGTENCKDELIEVNGRVVCPVFQPRTTLLEVLCVSSNKHVEGEGGENMGDVQVCFSENKVD